MDGPDAPRSRGDPVAAARVRPHGRCPQLVPLQYLRRIARLYHCHALSAMGRLPARQEQGGVWSCRSRCLGPCPLRQPDLHDVDYCPVPCVHSHLLSCEVPAPMAVEGL